MKAGGLLLPPCLAILLLASPLRAQTETVLGTDHVIGSGDQFLSVGAILAPTIRDYNIIVGIELGGIGSIATATPNGAEVIASLENQAVGVAMGTQYSGLGTPLVSRQGHVAFSAFLTGPTDQNSGIWAGMGQTHALIVREGYQAPDSPAGALIASLKNPVLNDHGEVAFIGFLRTGAGGVNEANNGGLWAGAAGSSTLVAREGDAAPGTQAGAVFASVWGSPSLNNHGQVAFRNSLIPGLGGTTRKNDEGIWSGTAGALNLLGREGMQTPGMAPAIVFNRSGPTTTFSNPAINDAGAVAFIGWLDGPGVDDHNNHAIWTGQPGALQLAVQAGDAAPGTSTSFSRLLTPSINHEGRLLFRGVLALDDSVSAANDRGIWSGLPGDLALIAREGDPAPGAAAGTLFKQFSTASTNAQGHIAFMGSLANNSGGVDASNDHGLWIADPHGVEIFQIAREGEVLADGTITTLAFAGGSGGEDGRRSGLNDDGQVAYTASLDSGGDLLQLFTPVLHWRSSVSGSWDQRFNWTLATRPAIVHDVLIDPTTPLTVEGPGATMAFINSLAVGGGGADTRLNLHQGDLALSRNLTIHSDGTIDLALSSLQVEDAAINEGLLFVGTGGSLKNDEGLLNSGLIDLGGGDISGDGLVTNTIGGVIQGGGGVSAALFNAGGLIHATGNKLTIERFNGGNSVNGILRVDTGSELSLSADAVHWQNWGVVEMGGPAAVLAGHTTINHGSIVGAGEVHPHLYNHGIVQATSGILALMGPAVLNKPGGEMIVMEGAVLRVTNDFSNEGSVMLHGGVFEHLAAPTLNLFDVGGHGQFIGNHWTNDGVMHFSGGLSSIDGAVTNTAMGSLILSSATASFNHHVTSAGTIENNEGHLHFLSGLTLNNLLITDPAETFFTDLIVREEGFIQAESGDHFWVAGNFENSSVMNTQWETSRAALLFHDGPNHVMEVVGLDHGPIYLGYLDNFAWGTLELETGVGLTLSGASVADDQIDLLLSEDLDFPPTQFPDDLPGHALYVTNLLLQDGISQIASISSDGTAIYYDPESELNSYLEGGVYAMEGGGFIAPIGAFIPPVVPAPLAVTSAGAMLFFGGMLRWHRQRRA